MSSPHADDACISDLVLDRLAVGELTADDPKVRHLAHCQKCQTRARRLTTLAAHEASRLRPPLPSAQFRETSTSETIGPVDRPFTAVRRTIVVAASLAAVLGAVVFSTGPGTTPAATGETSDEAMAVRSKGGTTIGMHIKRGAHVFRARPGETLQAGDRVRFQVRHERPAYFLIAGLDPTGRATAYHPQSGLTEPLAADVRHNVDSALLLDNSAQNLRVIALFCPDQRPVASLVSALNSTQADALDDDPRTRGCTTAETRLRSHAKPPSASSLGPRP